MWVLNLMLYFFFVHAQVFGDWMPYISMKAQGAGCFTWIGEGPPTIQQPPCFYTDTNAPIRLVVTAKNHR